MSGIEIINVDGTKYIVIEGPVLGPKTDKEIAKYALTLESFKNLGERGQFSTLSQLYGLVIPGLILSTHLFQGLNRNLYCDNGFEGDKDKYVFSRKPAYDYYWSEELKREEKTTAPANQVFVVLVSANKNHNDKYPEIAGWIEHWNWVDEDTVLPEAPIDWVDRYKEKLWN